MSLVGLTKILLLVSAFRWNFVDGFRSKIAAQIITDVNADDGVLWKAGPTKFDTWSPASINDMLGVLATKIAAKRSIAAKERQSNRVGRSKRSFALPENFDPRKKWPECSETLSEIRDQGSCGSCWAFGAVEAMSDRICIKSKGKEKTHLSAVDLVACCPLPSMGCNGGFLETAWQFWIDKGIVTGGNYRTSEGCLPYPIHECEHHANGTKPPCDPSYMDTPKCVRICNEEYTERSYQTDKHYGKGQVRSLCMEEDIMEELYTNGPVEAAFLVFEDLLNYHSGIYHHVYGSMVGGHAIKIIGWGVDRNGTKYWTVANSWNNDWGENGFFRILRGTDECGIESYVTFGEPKLAREDAATDNSLSQQHEGSVIVIQSKWVTFRFLSAICVFMLIPLLALTMFMAMRSRSAALAKAGYNRIQ